MARSLYICYFGVREPLVQTQVLPYLRELKRGSYPAEETQGREETQLKVSILTFEPDSGFDVEAVRKYLAAEGINWYWLPYHKRFSVIATAWDIFRGVLFIRRFIARERPDVLHGRVHVPTLMGAIARKLSYHKPKLLFDIRGFFPEEYTDAGVWPENGLIYRMAKWVERWLMKESDGFVVLTEKARSILFPESADAGRDKYSRPVEVIPCCVDLARFRAVNGNVRAEMRAKLGIDGKRVIAYVGSFGGWYLTDEMLDFFEAARSHDPKSFVMILTQRDKDIVIEKLRSKGFRSDEYFIDSAKPHELRDYLAAADLALSFIKVCYSKQASSPTKVAEYLACGLPIVSNRGVGDLDELIERNHVGALINGFSTKSYLKALETISKLGKVDDRCFETAEKEFDLNVVGGERYRRIYKRILQID